MTTVQLAVPLHVRTRVQPGHRVVIENDELPDGADVDVAVTLTPPPSKRSIPEILASSPAITRTPEEWEAFERQFQEDRNSWDR